MKAPALERTSSAKAGWLIILLVAGWLAFLLIQGTTRQPAPKPAALPLPSTSLTRAGLHNYTDWDGLPEIFAIWADKAEWKNGQTRFAYWHPVMKNYSYYFEAVRVKDGYRFREIAEPHEPGYDWDESLGEDCPIRFYLSDPVVKLNSPGPAPVSQSLQGEKEKPADVRIELPPPEKPVIPATPAPKP